MSSIQEVAVVPVPGHGCANLRMSSVVASTLCVLVVLVCAMPALAEDAPNPNDEAAQYKKEEAEARELKESGSLCVNYAGKYTAFTQAEIDAGSDPKVIGKFEIENATHLVKPLSDDIIPALKELNGKMCILNGKLRNNKKYIYVEGIVKAGAENAFQGRRGGL